jgi:hypothetical protein
MNDNTDLATGKRLFVGDGKPEILGRDKTEVRGGAYIEGPAVIGNPSPYNKKSPNDLGTLMVAETVNPDMKPIPFYSLFVQTYARIKSFLKVDTLLNVKLVKAKIVYTEVLMAKSKNFLIDHPTKKKKKLVHACLEGPENAVYIRGRLRNDTVIELPEYWEKLIDRGSITVSLTPIGAHQDIIVKRIEDNSIILQSNGNMPIDCYYHVFAERIDIEKLKTEIDNA